MKILVVGGGGREHVLIWKIKQSPLVNKMYSAPGNGGIARLAECVDISAEDIEGLVKFAKDKRIDLTVVGPEAPLVAGIVDRFEGEGLKIFGPSAKAAQLEGSKVFAKEFMHRCNIPTAIFKTFTDIKEAKVFAAKGQYPLVVKADGLAAGKGVLICKDNQEAEKALDEIMKDKIFKEAGNQIVIEECLLGEEASILAISDGVNYILLEPSQDHKRIFDDDIGPNTGGMGAYSPAPVINGDMLKKIEARIIDPAIRGMNREGNPFRGVLYAGLMITENGPMALEFNVRFGDPEAQAVLPRLKNDLVEMMVAATEERLNDYQLSWDKRACVCVVISSGGYPGKFEKGKEITGLEEVDDKSTFVFHAGTKKEGAKLVTNGGRVLGIVSLDNTIEDTIHRVYRSVEKIKFDRCFFRRDIGAKALQRHASHR
jgi:phosphoribosylamine---glycine ligase